jgi:uncharacterized protein YndB with AHSA1/START domain
MAATDPTTDTAPYEGEVRIDAPPEVVYRYLTEPELHCRWEGTKAELDPRPGGIYRVEIIPGTTARGEFVELDPPNRVVFTFGWEGEGQPIPPGASRVEIDLTADGDTTLLQIRHSGLPTDAVDGHRTGWEHYTERLVIAAAGGDPGRDAWLDGPPEM